MSLSRNDLEAGNIQTRLLEASHSGIKLTTLSEDELNANIPGTVIRYHSQLLLIALPPHQENWVPALII